MILFDVISFSGRFHPIFVHLPIGLIVVAVILDWKNSEGHRDGVIKNIWFWAGVTGVVSAICGWFLANDGAYDNWTLFFHRWGGISIAILSFLAWWLRKKSSSKKVVKTSINWALILLLLVTGHLGGNMTHGSDYLIEYAPKPIQSLLGYGNLPQEPDFGHPDSIIVYTDLIQPIFERKCLNCHNADVQNGGLDMSSQEGLMKGGDGGSVIDAGDINSELVRRVILPTSSSKFMPTSGTPMTYNEVKILEWWIEHGASFNDRLMSLEANKNITQTLLTAYNIDITPRPWIEKNNVDPLNEEDKNGLKSSGWKAQQVSIDKNWISIEPSGSKEINREMLKSLALAKKQIIWLDLSEREVDLTSFNEINSLTHLTRLDLSNTNVGSEEIFSLTQLTHLESLNLTESQVEDSIFDHLGTLPGLKRIYLWQSQVTDEGVDKGRTRYPDIDIVHKSSL